MKRLFLSLFMILICAVSLNAQQIDNRFLEKTGVINVDSVSKNDLFSMAQSWFGETFKDSKNVLEISDKDQGKLFGKGLISIGGYHGYVSFNITILVKDGKYKYIISDFTSINVPYCHGCTKPMGGPFDFGSLTQNETPAICSYWKSGHKEKCWIEIKETALIDINNLINNLLNYMSKKNIQKNTDF